MNVACPECSTVYRIDPARVPDGGTAARCRECDRVFRVEAEGLHQPGQVMTAAPVEEGASAAGHREAEPSATAWPEPTPPEAAPPEATAPEATAGEAGPSETTPSEPAAAPAAPAFGPQDPQTRARRLARALVSDIKVYNADRWEQSRQQGRLRKDFRDEILKSWDEYVEQVGQDMAKRTPYFRNALNEILAEGESVF